MGKSIFTNSRKYLSILLLCFLVLVISPIRVFAEGPTLTPGAGAGSQSNSAGTSGQKPLSFISATLVEGNASIINSKSVPLKPKIEFVFDKNVVNSLIWQNNSKCFTMSTNNGNVPIIVSKVDDTIDFSKRQSIFVEPVNALLPGTQYVIRIDPDLQAKNGVSTLGGTTNGKGLVVTFKTEGEAPVADKTGRTSQPSPSVTIINQVKSGSGTAVNKDKPISSNTTKQDKPAPSNTASIGNPDSSNTVNQNKTDSNITANKDNSGSGITSKTDSAPSKTSGFHSSIAVYIGVVLIICWIVIEIVNMRKKKKNL